MGSKGAGKSALFQLAKMKPQSLPNNTILIACSDFEGQFQGSDFDNATSRQFETAWRLYFLSAIVTNICPASKISQAIFANVAKSLGSLFGSDLHKTTTQLMIAGILKYVRSLANQAELEVKISGFSVKASGEIDDETKQVPLSLLYDTVNKALQEEEQKVWINIDRLDSAFGSSADVERNALRGLIDATKATLQYNSIQVKLFLRSDIWKTIIEKGVPNREATHLVSHKLQWSDAALMQLMFVRTFYVDTARDFTMLPPTSEQKVSLREASEQLYKLFPDQVDAGEKKPKTLDWILSRLRDATNEIVPRDLVYFLVRLREIQSKRIEDGEATYNSESRIFDSDSLKQALVSTSEYKLQQFLYSEHPNLYQYCELLRDGTHKIQYSDIVHMWKLNKKATDSNIRRLVSIGFFKPSKPIGKIISKETYFTVPFIYRGGLGLTYPY